MSDPAVETPSRAALTDSPWFWVMVFAAMGVVLLLVIMPKYSKRQSRLELQYQARQEIHRRQVEGTPARREPGQEGEAPPPAQGDLIIELWPLALAFSALFLLAAAMLIRSRRHPLATAQARSAP